MASAVWYADLPLSAKLLNLEGNVCSVVLLPRGAVSVHVEGDRHYVVDLSEELLTRVKGWVFGPYGDHCVCSVEEGKILVECKGTSVVLRGRTVAEVAAGPSRAFIVRRTRFGEELFVVNHRAEVDFRGRGRKVELYAGGLGCLAILRARGNPTLIFDALGGFRVEVLGSRPRSAGLRGLCAAIILEDSVLLVGPKSRIALPYSGESLRPLGYIERGFLVADDDYTYLVELSGSVHVVGRSEDASKLLVGVDVVGRPLLAVDCSDRDLVGRIKRLSLEFLCIDSRIREETNLWSLISSSNFVLLWPKLVVWSGSELLFVDFRGTASVVRYGGSLLSIRGLEGCKVHDQAVICGQLSIRAPLLPHEEARRVEQLYTLALVADSPRVLLCGTDGRCGEAVSAVRLYRHEPREGSTFETVASVTSSGEATDTVTVRVDVEPESVKLSGDRALLRLNVALSFDGWQDLAHMVKLTGCLGCSCRSGEGVLEVLLEPKQEGWPTGCTAVYEVLGGIKILVHLDDVVRAMLHSEMAEVEPLGVLPSRQQVILVVERAGRFALAVGGRTREHIVETQGVISVQAPSVRVERPYGLVELCIVDRRGRKCRSVPFYDETYCTPEVFACGRELCFKSRCTLMVSEAGTVGVAGPDAVIQVDPTASRYALIVSAGEGSASFGVVDLLHLSLVLAVRSSKVISKLLKLL